MVSSAWSTGERRYILDVHVVVHTGCNSIVSIGKENRTTVHVLLCQVIWEYYDGGLWNSLPDSDSFRIEAHYSESDNSFYLGEAQMAFHYSLGNMTRSHPRTKVYNSVVCMDRQL